MSGHASDYVPAVKYGNKWFPEDIAGIVGLPYVSNVIYVDPANGNDTANNGTSFNDALATVSAAFDAATANQHDVVLIAPSGGTGRATETSAITWNKRFTHLVGNAAPTAQDARAGISFGTGGSLTVSENGCLFKTLTLTGTADINVPVTITGSYNSFLGVDFKGSLNSDSGDDTASRALYINGGQENFFGGCTFGADTFMRSAANATIEFASAASRNQFDGCEFVMAADAETPVHILLTGTSAIDRWLKFNNCTWYAFYTNHSAKVNAVINASAQTATGDIIMSGTQVSVGFDDWEAVASNIVWFQPWTATANAIGLGVNNA